MVMPDGNISLGANKVTMICLNDFFYFSFSFLTPILKMFGLIVFVHPCCARRSRTKEEMNASIGLGISCVNFSFSFHNQTTAARLVGRQCGYCI